MANLLNFDGGEVTSIPSGAILPIHARAATQSGWQDYRITAANFLKAVTDNIAALQADIVNLNYSVYQINAYFQIIQFGSVSGSGSYTVDGDNVIEYIYFNRISGTPTVRIGLTNGGEELMSDTLITGMHVESLDYPIADSENIYYSVTGGAVDMKLRLTLM